MKKLNQVIAGTLILGGLLSSGGQAFAEQTISGENEAEIKVNGILGDFDNTTDGPDPEDLDMWINVTMPTTALFYSNPENITEIVSPKYTVTNNSARGVQMSVSDITETSEIDLIDTLEIVSETSTIELISNGAVSLIESSLLTLENNEGTDRVGEFEFQGLVSDTVSGTEVNPFFSLVYKFETVLPAE